MMTTKIEKALSLGKTQGARKLLEEYYLAEDKRQWTEAKQDEYYTMYPTYRDMTVEEQLVYDKENFNEENPKPLDNEEFTFEYPKVEIVYITTEIQEVTETLEDGSNVTKEVEVEVRTPAEYVTYNEYINETRIVSEAVDATYDEEGMELTPYQPEVTELVRPYVADDVTPLVDAYIGSKYAELRKAEYPDIGEQLDMQYKDMLDGGTRFKDAIAAVKAKYPKE